MIDQVSRPIGHAAATTARTESTTLARERDQPIETAAGTSEPRESRRQAAARQEVSKFLLNESRQAMAIAHAGDLTAEGLVVIADQLMQGDLLGSTRPIDGGGGRHAPNRRKGRT